MVYNYTSSREVVAKIYADLDIQEEMHRISDIREWITEAVEKIGAFDQFVRKSVEVPVHDFRVRLPRDFHSMVQCAYSFSRPGRSWLPMRKATGSFQCVDFDPHWHHGMHHGTLSVPTSGDIMDQLRELIIMTYSIGRTISNAEADAIIANLLSDNGSGDVNNVMPILMSMINTNFGHGGSRHGSSNRFEPQYISNGGVLNTNVRHGSVMMSYNAFAVDETGFPMVPDLASYKEALYWYVVMKLKFVEMLTNRVNPNIYQMIERKWHIYRKQAYGECIMPDADAMESVQNEWLRIVPELGDHDSFFKHAGQKQNLYNKNGTPFSR